LCSLLKINLSLDSPTPEVWLCVDFDGRSERPIPSGHDFPDDTHCDNLEDAIEV